MSKKVVDINKRASARRETAKPTEALFRAFVVRGVGTRLSAELVGTLWGTLEAASSALIVHIAQSPSGARGLIEPVVLVNLAAV